jgi:dTDP-4-dehydrorhamnose reductase
MTRSFMATGTGALAKVGDAGRRRVLVTGAAGRIGAYFAEHSGAKYELRLLVREGNAPEALRAFGEVVTGELTDLARLKEHCRGIDTVVHMAGEPDAGATWQGLLDANIVGTYNVFVAAKAAGCRRVIHASSIHAVSGYPPDIQVKTSDPVNPGDLYGVSKCFGEALARYMAEQEGLSAITLRIGAFQPLETARREDSVRLMDAFVSHRDLNQLIERCIDVENLQFAIFHGLSEGRFKRLDISDARELVGYDPQDDLTRENPRLKDLRLNETVIAHSLRDGTKESGLRDDL